MTDSWTVLAVFQAPMPDGALVDLDYDSLPETTHFLQLEAPEKCAALTVEYLEGQGLI